MRCISLFALLALLGCQTVHTLPVEDRSRVIAAPFDAVWVATVDAFTASGYPIETIDRTSGLISTGYQSTGGVRAAVAGRQRDRASALIRALDSTRTQITLTFHSERGAAFGGYSSNATTGGKARDVYRASLDNIEQRATGH